MRVFLIAATAAAAMALSGCAATTVAPVKVTRFHLGQALVPTPGPIVAAAPSPSLERSVFDAAVARELGRVGFPSADAASARYRYSVDVTRDLIADAPRRRSPFTIGVGVGGGSGGYGSGGIGGGVGASVGLGGNRNATATTTRLLVRIIDRTTSSTLWEGRAETSASDRSRYGDPSVIADKLARALFRDYPGVSGRTVTVPQ